MHATQVRYSTRPPPRAYDSALYISVSDLHVPHVCRVCVAQLSPAVFMKSIVLYVIIHFKRVDTFRNPSNEWAIS